MPRKPRIDAPDTLHHIILRGTEGKKIFLDDADRDQFLLRLSHLQRETSTSCYAWALLPDRAHLLLKTGTIPLASLMLRLLTGYVVTFNRRHARRGPLFQSRYTSILCQEEPYLLELVRYIHLAPLRRGVVRNLSELGKYRYSGHSYVLGRRKNDWQSVNHVLDLFGARKPKSQERYREYAKQGVREVQGPELSGGGPIRSAGGMSEFRRLRKNGRPPLGDARILGDSKFVARVLLSAEERSKRKRKSLSPGPRLDRLTKRVSSAFNVKPRDIYSHRKHPASVKARSVFCYWAVKELGESATALARKLGVSQPAVSISVKRGARIVSDMGLRLSEK
jgi:putative transposase